MLSQYLACLLFETFAVFYFGQSNRGHLIHQADLVDLSFVKHNKTRPQYTAFILVKGFPTSLKSYSFPWK